MRNTRHIARVVSLILIVAMLFPMLPLPAVEAARTNNPAAAAGIAPLSAPAAAAQGQGGGSPRFRLPALALNVQSTPAEVPAGEMVTFTIQLANAGDDVVHGVQVSGTLPIGLECRDCEGFHSPGNRRLHWTFGTLEAGEVLTLTFAAAVTAEAGWMGGVPLQLSTRGVEVPTPRHGGVVVHVPYPRADRPTTVVLPAGQEGQLVSTDGRLTVTLPAEAVPVTLTLVYTPTSSPPGNSSHPLRHFALTAYDLAGQEIHTFTVPLEITYRYLWAEAVGLDLAGGVHLARWDEDMQTWRYTPAQVDTERQLVTAQTTHLSELLLEDNHIKVPSDDYMPQLQGFQEIDLFSGAATYAYPIQVPPGRGGLTPQLQLSYSSGSVDWPAQAWAWGEDAIQAGWAGYGWSLGESYIGVQNVEGQAWHEYIPEPPAPPTPKCEADYKYRDSNAVYSLVLNGAGHDLVPGTDGKYHTMDETYWQVWSDWEDTNDPLTARWFVRTTDGTTYTFDKRLLQVRCNPPVGEECDPSQDGAHEIYKWLLTQVEDPHGNRIEYAYDEVTTDCPTLSGDKTCHVTTYLREISYNFYDNGTVPLTKITLERESRQDQYAPNNGTRCPEDFIQLEKLDRITVWMSVGGEWQLFRKYYLTHDYSTYEDKTQTHSKLTLRAVQECGPQDLIEVCMPAATFTYYPPETLGENRLQRVANGFGGQVTYTYEPVTEIHDSRKRVVTRVVEDGLGNSATWHYAYSPAEKNMPKIEGGLGACDFNSRDAGTADPRGDFGPRTRVTQEFRGHDTVTVTDPDNNVQIHYFLQEDEDKGREEKVEYYDAANHLYRQVMMAYASFVADEDKSSISYTYADPEIAFTYLFAQEAFDYDGWPYDPLDPPRRQKTVYEYREESQDGDQYGNLTHIWEYDENDQVYRFTQHWYYPNAEPEVWIVDRLAAEAIWEGSAAQHVDMVAATWYYYDDNQQHTIPPGQYGDLTRVQRLLPCTDPVSCVESGWLFWYTGETEYAYQDGYGNLTDITTFAGPGLMKQNASIFEEIYRLADPTIPRLTTIDYNDHGGGYYLYPERVVYPLASLVETAEYDYQFGVLTQYTDMNGDATDYTYDNLARLEKKVQPGDSFDFPTVRVWYENWGSPGTQRVRVQRRENPDPMSGGTLDEERYFDGLGRLIQVHQEAGPGQEVLATTLYDDLGRVAAEAVPYFWPATNVYEEPGDLDANPRTRYTYDPLGRVTLVQNTDDSTVQTIYDHWQTTTIDENGHQTVRENDAFGRLVTVNEYIGDGDEEPYELYATTNYDYDVRDLLVSVTDAAGNVTTMDYDLLGRKTYMDDPDMGAWLYAYDAVGNLVKQRDARQEWTCLYYDELDRLTSKHYRQDDNCPPGNAGPIHYQYDQGDNGLGRRIGMADLSGSAAWAYDDRGRVVQETKVVNDPNPAVGGTFVTQWGYDSMDRLDWIRYPADNAGNAGEQVDYGYNSRGLLSSVIGTDVYVRFTDHDAAGRMELQQLGQFGSGAPVVVQDYAYYEWRNDPTPNGRGRLKEIQAGPAGLPTTLQNLRYFYDGVGNVMRIEDYVAGDPERRDFTYDDLNRLEKATASGSHDFSESYTYTPIGNLTHKGDVDYQYLDAAHVHAVTNLDEVQRFWYDANGNQLERLIEGTTYNLAYNTENKLVQVVGGGAVVDFVYDGDGQRVKRTIGEASTVYVGNYFEWSSTGMVSYYYAGGQRVAMRVGNNPGTLSFLLTDHLGSTAVVVDKLGVKMGETHYMPFGEEWYGDELPTDYLFTGQRLEEGLGGAAGLYDYGARYYDPYIQRWISPDTLVPYPENPQSLNRYSYVQNRPLNRVDPTGHKDDWSTGGGGGGGGGGLFPFLYGATRAVVNLGKTLIAALCLDGNPTNELQQGADVLNKTIGADGDYTNEAQLVGQGVQEVVQGLEGKAAASDVALGLSEYGQLDSFATSTGSYTYQSWDSVGLANEMVHTGQFEQYFTQAMNNARTINFNLTGIEGNIGKFAELGGRGGFGSMNIPYTARELYLILQNPDWLAKAVFWLNGQVVTAPTTP